MFHILPSYDDAVRLCDENDCFYEVQREVNGTTFSIFNYRFATSTDFKERGALEMRGLTFRHAKDGTKVRFLMLHKFFNVGENDTTLVEDLNEKKIDKIFDKLDGSMIRFVVDNDGCIIAKTKLGFDNDQAGVANKILNSNADLYEFVKDSFDYGLALIFEYTSPYNRIVIPYKEEKLTLIQIREEATGVYVNDLNFIRDIEGVDKAKAQTFTVGFGMNNIEQLINIGFREMRDAEGYVIRFTDGQHVKAKTPWYVERHRLMTQDFDHENFIIEMILDEKIDDLIVILEKDCLIRKYVEKLMFIIRDYNFSMESECLKILDKAYIRRDSRKDFAVGMNGHPFFGAMMKAWEERDRELLQKGIKDSIKKNTNRLNKAREWLEIVVGFQYKACKEVLLEE